MRDRAAVRIDMRRIVGQAEVARHRQRLRGEGFVQLDHVHLGDRQAEPARAPSCVAGDGPKPMIARRQAGRGHAEHARARLQPVLVRRRLATRAAARRRRR